MTTPALRRLAGRQLEHHPYYHSPRRRERIWYALEERRDQIRAAGQGFSERQHHQFREAHAAGKLINDLCASMEGYYPGRGDPYYLRPMAQAIKHVLPTWEDVLIRKGEPWTPFVTAAARRGSQKCILDAKAYIPFL